MTRNTTREVEMYEKDEVVSVGIFRIEAAEERYSKGRVNTEVHFRSTQFYDDELTMTFSEEEHAAMQDRGISLRAGSDVEIAFLNQRGA